MIKVPCGRLHRKTLPARQRVRHIAGSLELSPIMVETGESPPRFEDKIGFSFGLVIVGMNWLIENEPELAASAAFGVG